MAFLILCLFRATLEPLRDLVSASTILVFAGVTIISNLTPEKACSGQR
jgi:hypothetical protein